MQRHLVIFAKEPRIGRVKTRLAREIGAVAAWRFYREMLRTLPRRLSGPWQVWLAVSPDHALRRTFLQGKMKFMAQGKGDLGQRMAAPSKSLPSGPFIVVGTDIPDMQPHMIAKAFKLLGRKDVVFGPASDGGFWLVGIKRHPIQANPYGPKSVRWSHPETLQDCLKNLKNKKVGFVDQLSDVDTAADLITRD